MMLSCIRCRGRATTVLTYHHADATAYLDSARGHEKSYDGILLCDAHAQRFTAPVGWTIEDHRSDVRIRTSDIGHRTLEQRSQITDHRSQTPDVDRTGSVDPDAD